MLLSFFIFLLTFSWITSFHIPQTTLFRSHLKCVMVQKKEKYTGKLRPGQLSPKRFVPEHIMRPDYATKGKPKEHKYKTPFGIPMNSPAIIEKMRKAGQHAREVLDAAIRVADVGVTTDTIDAIVHEETIKRNCYPSPLNYNGFPKSCCTSINEVICHGIPDSTVLQDGDIVNIDVTVFCDGVHGDCSETILIGKNTSQAAKDLVKTTYDAWQAAIAICRPGVPYNAIGAVIEDMVRAKGYTSMEEFIGHG